MYAVIETGGKQYKVEPGQTLHVEKLDGDVGTNIEFDRVLLIANDGNVALGQPLVAGARVTAKILDHDRGERLIVYKFRPKKNYRRKNGHRQHETTVKITGITA